MSCYAELGVSARKSDVKEALNFVSHGLYPLAFCKIVPDVTAESEATGMCTVMHSDGAGTKSSIAYLYWKETNDISVFRGIVQDSIVMNIDDILCVGAIGPVYLSNTIGRNAILVSKEVIRVLIETFEVMCSDKMFNGVKILLTGGETADAGDIVRTLIVDTTVLCRMPRSKVINTQNIQPGDVIIGLSSYGKSSYEQFYNSGIGSNGLTLAKHALLHKSYFKLYPESCDPLLDETKAYRGKYFLSDELDGTPLTIGQALLSPTRTYTPIITSLLDSEFAEQVHAFIHCSGGGQTKCLNFGKGLKYVKDNCFPCPPIFEVIQNSSSIPWNQMYEIFNMGHRFEIYGPMSLYEEVLKICKFFEVECRIVGCVSETTGEPGKNVLTIASSYGTFDYHSGN